MITRCPDCAAGRVTKHRFGRTTLEHCRACRGTGFIDRVERETSRRCRLLARIAERLTKGDAS